MASFLVNDGSNPDLPIPPVMEMDAHTTEEEPWKVAGADITDYFNYGFNEETFRAYSAKQINMRMRSRPDYGLPMPVSLGKEGNSKERSDGAELVRGKSEERSDRYRSRSPRRDRDRDRREYSREREKRRRSRSYERKRR